MIKLELALNPESYYWNLGHGILTFICLGSSGHFDKCNDKIYDRVVDPVPERNSHNFP